MSFIGTRLLLTYKESEWLEYAKYYFKENARTFSKNFTTQENIRIPRLKKRRRSLLKKENFKPEIKPMIEMLPDDLYHIENNQAKGAKLHANIRWELEEETCSKTFSKVLERQNLQNETMSGLYADDDKSKYSSNPKDILKFAKKLWNTLHERENLQLDKAATTEFFTKITNRKKISTSTKELNLCEVKKNLYDIIKYIASQKTEFPGNDGLRAEFYKHFYN